MRGRFSWGVIAVGVLVLSGCVTPPEQVYTQVQPQTAPARNLTSMDEALTCMDRLLAQHPIPPIYLTSPGLPSRAGDKVNLRSGPDMLRNAISELSKTNNVFRFLELSHLAPASQTVVDTSDIKPFDPASVQKWIDQLKKLYPKGGQPKSFVYPEWVIGGSISQLDDNVLSETRGAGLEILDIGDFGLERDQILSVVTVDLYLYDWDTLQMRNGSAVANSMAIIRSGRGGDLGGRIKKAGIYLDFSYDRSEGLHQAVRTLIQLSTIELLGKLAQVPYEQCLRLERTQPRTIATLEKNYDQLPASERTKVAQEGLARIPKPGTEESYYTGPVTGQTDTTTRRAVSEYQKDAGLIPSGETDFSTYRKLQGPAPVKPLQLEIDTVRGPTPVYQQGEKLDFSVTVDQAAEVHCFIRNNRNEVRRLFPNRSQPNARLEPGASITIPGPNPSFVIDFDRAGVVEQIGCVASPVALASPWPVELDVLRAPTLPVQKLEELEVGYRQRTAGPVVLQTMTVRVQ